MALGLNPVRGAGTITIVNDGSGGPDLADVEGNVRIECDSSGHIDIEAVRGNAHVGSDSSGDIVFLNVRGTASALEPPPAPCGVGEGICLDSTLDCSRAPDGRAGGYSLCAQSPGAGRA